jgi:hypothetical protein
MKLSTELICMIHDELSSKDIENLRCVSRASRQLLVILFRRLLMDDMPWLWEAHVMAVGNNTVRIIQLLEFLVSQLLRFVLSLSCAVNTFQNRRILTFFPPRT